MNFASKSTGWTLLTRGIKCLAVSVLLLTAVPSFAEARDGQWDNGRHFGNDRGRYEHHAHRYWYNDRWHSAPYYVAQPRVVYAPPVFYAPPPVYQEPGLTLVLPLNFR